MSRLGLEKCRRLTGDVDSSAGRLISSLLRRTGCYVSTPLTRDNTCALVMSYGVFVKLSAVMPMPDGLCIVRGYARGGVSTRTVGRFLGGRCVGVFESVDSSSFGGFLRGSVLACAGNTMRGGFRGIVLAFK